MFDWISKKLKRSHGMPKSAKEYWYCGEWYMYRSDERKAKRECRSDHMAWPVEGKLLFNPWQCGVFQTADKNGLVDGLIPAYRKGNRVGLYKVIGNRYRTTTWYDGLPWDDGYNVDLKLVKKVYVDKVPSLCTPES